MQNIKVIWLYRLALVLLSFLCLLVFYKLKPMWIPLVDILKIVLTPFLIAYFIAYLLHPLIEKLHTQGVPRTIAILLIYILFFGGVGYGVYKAIPVAISQLQEMNRNFPEFMRMYESWTNGMQKQISSFPEFIGDRLHHAVVGVEARLQNLIGRLMSTAKGILDSLLIIILVPFIVFYILKDYGELYHIFWRLVPTKWRSGGQQLIKSIDESLGNYIRGQLFVCTALGVLASLALWIVGLKYPLLLGVLIGITDIIPYFGPILGAIPTLIVAATISISMVIKVAITLIVLQFVESNILSPYIVGKTLHMHPVVIMLALLAGGEMAGLAGLLLAVPILAVVRAIAIHIRPVWGKR